MRQDGPPHLRPVPRCGSSFLLVLVVVVLFFLELAPKRLAVDLAEDGPCEVGDVAQEYRMHAAPGRVTILLGNALWMHTEE